MTPDRVKERKIGLARWVREGLIKLGPTFIKIGQQFSTRVDVLSPEFVKELESLQVPSLKQYSLSKPGAAFAVVVASRTAHSAPCFFVCVFIVVKEGHFRCLCSPLYDCWLVTTSNAVHVACCAGMRNSSLGKANGA